MAVDRPVANIVLMYHAQAKLPLDSNKEPIRPKCMEAEIEKSRRVIRNARKPEGEPKHLKLMVGIAIGAPRHVAKVKLAGIENEVEKARTKPLEPEIEPENHNEKN